MMLEATSRLEAEMYSDYVKRLEKTVEKLGEGVFSKVFQHPELPNVAVKIVRDDDKYTKYARFCLANKGNKWVPRIYKRMPLDLEDKWATVHVLFMEKLRPTSSAQVRKFFEPYSQFVTKHKHTRMLRTGWDFIATHDDDEDLRKLAAFLSKTYADLDLADHNFMRRGQQLVFNDPVS